MEQNQLNEKPMQIYPLSLYQKDIWVEQCVYKGEPIYNIAGYAEIEGRIDYCIFKKAVQKLINDNESLRIRMLNKEGEPYQKIVENLKYELPLYDFSKKECGEEFYLEWMQKECLKPFNFDNNENLFQIVLIKANDNKYFYFVKVHHIVCDGWGGSILFKEVVNNYNTITEQKNNLEKCSYLEFIKENKRYQESKAYLKDKEFWKNKREYIPEGLFIKSLNSNGILISNRESMVIERRVYDEIIEYCSNKKCSVFHFFLGIMGIYFGKVCNKEDIVIGVPILNRTKASHKQIVGHFANVIPLKINIMKEKNFSEIMNEIKMELRTCYRHQKFPLGEIRKGKKEGLFDITLSYEHHDYTANFNGTTTDIKMLSNHHERNSLAVFIREFDEYKDVEVNFDYKEEVFKKFLPIENVIKHIEYLIKSILNSNEKSIRDIEILTEEEKHQLLVDFNDTKAEYPKDKTIYKLFEEQVEKTPENIAVVFEDKKLTYRQLNEKANSLARVLREKGVKADSIVGIMVDRSLEMIIGIMGILKSGGAYLPMSPDYPTERIQYMLEDSEISILLIQNHLKDKAKFKVELLDLSEGDLFKRDSSNLHKVSSSGNLAYIIYTSGTTGNPKGVMVEHNNVVRLMFNDKMPFDFNNMDVWTMFHSYCFDFSVWEMYGALLNGGKLVIVPEWITKDFEKYLCLLEREKVTILNQTPTAFYNLMNIECERRKKHLNLRYVVFGGEALKPEKLYKWKQKYDATKLINMYGITETTVHVTYKEISNEDIRLGLSNIGKPIPTLRAYIMNTEFKIQPIGVAGELCISGDGLARGYLNKPQLTEEKFVTNPYEPGERMYKTGDLARWLPNGNIEFIGRIDHQVKIRGFRIELGEIESQLLKNKHIKEAIVIDKEDKQGNKYLCAYIVSDKEVNVSELRMVLSKELPDYMIPAYFMKIEKMPLTPNGKIDRNALPEPDGNINTGVEYVVPRNEIEEKLVKVWSEVLGVGKIGIDDDFFALGGHSLNMLQVIQKVYEELGIELQYKELYQFSKLREVAEIIADKIINKDISNKISIDAKNAVLLLNEKKDNNIFAFPPIVTYGAAFKRLSDLLDEYSLYAFNYIEEEDKVITYVNMMKKIQKQGPYILMGYSAGCKLAFEVAKTLLSEGNEVEGIIMLDGYPGDDNQFTEEFIDNMEELTLKFLRNESPNKELDKIVEGNFFRDVLRKKMEHYNKYLSQESICKEKINVKIHLIKSEESNDMKVGEWEELTKKKVTKYLGHGKHVELITRGFAEKNIAIIKGILKYMHESNEQ